MNHLIKTVRVVCNTLVRQPQTEDRFGALLDASFKTVIPLKDGRVLYNYL